MKTHILLAALVLGFASQLASAEKTGYYLGAGFGGSAINFNEDDFSSQSRDPIRSTITRDRGYKIIGGYNFNENWGLEAGYADLGRFEDKWTATGGALTIGDIYQFNYKVNAWYAGVKGTLPITGAVAVFGKLGVTVNTARNDFTYGRVPTVPSVSPAPGFVYPPFSTSSVFSDTGNHENRRLNALISVGLEYNISQHMSIRIEHEDFGTFGDVVNIGRARLSMTSLGGIYRF